MRRQDGTRPTLQGVPARVPAGLPETVFFDVEKQLDFRSLEFLDPGVFTDRPEGMPREADVVAKLETRNGDPALVLIHVAVQLRPHPDFGARMHEYYTLLCSRYKLPVLPFALFLRGGKKGLGTQEYVRTLLGRNVTNFDTRVSIWRGWAWRSMVEEVVQRGAGLAALMDRSTIGDVERLRASLMRRVVQGEPDEEREFILIDLIQTYFGFTAQQMTRYRQLVSRKEFRDVQDVELTWADKLLKKGEERGMEKGLEQGREVGLLEGKREALLRC